MRILITETKPRYANLWAPRMYFGKMSAGHHEKWLSARENPPKLINQTLLPFFKIIPGPNRHRYHQNTNLKMLLQPLKTIPKQAHSLLARHMFRELYLQDVYIGEWHHPYHHYQQLWYLSSFQCTSCLFLSLSWIHSLQLPKTRGHHLPQRTRRKSRRANRLHLVWWPSLRQGHTETLLNVNWLRNIKNYACD